MKLSEVTIENFRCFEKLTIPLHPDLNVFVGVNGSGKTAVLDAIAIALCPWVRAALSGRLNNEGKSKLKNYFKLTDYPVTLNRSDDPVIIRENIKLSVEAVGLLENFPNGAVNNGGVVHKLGAFSQCDIVGDIDESYHIDYKYYDLKGFGEDEERRNHRLVSLPVIAYYRATRRFSQMPGMGDLFSLVFSRAMAFENALEAGTDYQAMCQWFYMRENTELREGHSKGNMGFEFSDLKAIRLALISAFEDVERVLFNGIPPTLAVSLAGSHGTSRILSVEQLSDGYRNMLALVMDYAYRLAIANPGWENPLEAPGILIIDELDLHLHPKWQQRVIPNLRKIFPNTQLIVATHSPLILTTVQPENIHIIKDQQLYCPPASTFGAEGSRALKLVMETENRPPDNENAIKIKELFGLINADKIPEASDLCQQLMVKMGRDEPTLIHVETILKNRLWEQELGL